MAKGGGSPLIAGALPWGQGGGGMFDYMGASDPEKALASHYQQAYNSALSMNQQNYANILKGYQQTQLAQMGSQQAINKGYGKLLNDVLGHVAKVGLSDRQSITDMYAQRGGETQQNLVGAGLGNSTVTESMRRGLTLDEAKANMQLSEQLSKMYAGYLSDIGTKQLAYRERAGQARTGLSSDQLNWMNSIQAQYPDASAYSQIAQGLGAAEEAQKARDYMTGLAVSAGQQAAYRSGYGGFGAMPMLAAQNAYGGMMDSFSKGGAFRSGDSGFSPGGMPGYTQMPQSGGATGGPSFAGSGPSNIYGTGSMTTFGGPTRGSGMGDYPQAGYNLGLGGYAQGPTGGLSSGVNPYNTGGGGFGGGFANPGAAFGASPGFWGSLANLIGG